MIKTGTITLEKACETFERFPDDLQLPSLHPRFVNIDSLRNTSYQPVFGWVKMEKIFLFSFLLSTKNL